MKKALRRVALLFVAMFVAVSMFGCASQKEIEKREKDYERIGVIRSVFNDYAMKTEYEKLDCVIIYQGQKGIIINEPTKIEGDEKLVKEFLADITKTYAKKIEFYSKGMCKKEYDKVVYTIKDGKVSVKYDKCK
ncbi:MAG: hypothetical protein PUA49_04615 [Butyrivibrio sp.]|nr:hypothetical protein [Butyrivibrio sp.]